MCPRFIVVFNLFTARNQPVVIDYSKQPTWELGVLMFEIAMGTTPFAGNSVTSLRNALWCFTLFFQEKMITIWLNWAWTDDFFYKQLTGERGEKCLLVNRSQLSQGREILRYYVKRSMPICLSTAHWKVLDSSKRFELMLFFSGGESGSKPQNGEYQAGLCVVFCLVLVVQWLFRAAIIASKPQLRVANP